ncbi:MAG: class B sortase [Clostridia bacterium]|nr:class B sortase [Clostridia bacterium]
MISKAVYFILKAGDRALNFLVLLSFIIAVIYGAYSIYDTSRLLNSAGSDKLQVYSPEQLGEESNGPGFEELICINDEVIGWISTPETGVNYPLCQTDNNEKYVNTDALGEFSLSGSIFLDYRNNSNFSDSFNMVYGHHMDKGKMFGDIVKFTEDDYFTEHKTGELILRNGSRQIIEFFACMNTTAYDTSFYSRYPLCDSGDYDYLSNEDWLQYIRNTAVQYRNTDAGERVIALSTCTNTDNSGRIILLGFIRGDEN